MRQEIRETLIETFDFVQEDNQLLDILLKLGEERQVEQGQVLITEGEKANYFYVVLHGNAKVTVSPGISEIKIYTASAGEIIGFSSLVEPRLYKGNVEAMSNMTVLAFDADELLPLFKKHPRLGYLIMYSVSQFLSQRLLHSMFELMASSEVR